MWIVKEFYLSFCLIAGFLQKNETLLQDFYKKHLAPPGHSGILFAKSNSQNILIIKTTPWAKV
jgi:hypothetical protein